ncbi:hypothetical protein [Aquimarina sp. SS2-1]|uniref:hypothetical protein n=1 Tax=Aquimarina besae TaxID=3342247 RepID=UPI003670626D
MKVLVEDIINNIQIADQVIELDYILKIIYNLSDDIDSKIILYNKTPFDFIMSIDYNYIHNLKIDHPIKLREVHKQCYATKKQCVAIVRELFEKGNIDNVPGFIDVPIQDFTLDEMIEFKKEEEMMLRGEDPFV